MPRVRADNDARYALRASFVDENGNILEAPIVIGSTAEDPRITDTQIANWDATYATVAAGSANWDTAYGWGDHGAAGYYVNGSPGTGLDGSTNLYHQNNIQCGPSTSGPVGFTINDGGGNANIVWNHFNNTAQTVGNNTARIAHNTDSTTSSNLSFRVGSGGAGPGEVLNLSAGVAYVAGQIRATGDVTAYYSDRRLKNVEGAIEEPLTKINQLHGVYYTPNAKARELGYTSPEREVGLLAQDVQAVLPEVVAPAPVDPQYITLKYERIVALLVEGIKELTSELEAVKLELKEIRDGRN